MFTASVPCLPRASNTLSLEGSPSFMQQVSSQQVTALRRLTPSSHRGTSLFRSLTGERAGGRLFRDTHNVCVFLGSGETRKVSRKRMAPGSIRKDRRSLRQEKEMCIWRLPTPSSGALQLCPFCSLVSTIYQLFPVWFLGGKSLLVEVVKLHS